MKKSKVLKIILILSGLLLIAVGQGMLFSPVNMLGKHDIDLGGNISLLNEMKSHGGVLLGSGILILFGAFFQKLSFTSILVSIVIYFSFAIGRIISIVIDGMPADGLLSALVFELVFGILGLFAFLKYREKNDNIVNEVLRS